MYCDITLLHANFSVYPIPCIVSVYCTTVSSDLCHVEIDVCIVYFLSVFYVHVSPSLYPSALMFQSSPGVLPLFIQNLL